MCINCDDQSYLHNSPQLKYIHLYCSFLSFLLSDGRIFYMTYEDDVLGDESGERVSDVEPFCGRFSLKNPWILWKAFYSAYLLDFRQPPYKVSIYQWVSRKDTPKEASVSKKTEISRYQAGHGVQSPFIAK